MLRNYLTIAWRHLYRHRTFTLLNVLGLSAGMTACLLILQYVRFEWNYDKISPNTPQIWRAFNETVVDGAVTTQDGNTHSALAPALKADLAEVVDYFRWYNGNKPQTIFSLGEEPVEAAHVWMSDPGFLRMFPQRFLAGNPEACLKEPGRIVLTETTARRFFPAGEALGQTLHIPGGPLSGNYVVEGIVADPPRNTHLKFNALLSYATRYVQGHRDNWGGYWDYTYFQLAPGADPEKVRRQLALYSDRHLQREGIRLAMQPFESIHLHSALTYEIEPNSQARAVFFLGWVALLILAIAFVNYINLSTARSLERAREVGLRKALGGRRGQLAGQFLLEGLLVNTAALAIALAATHQCLPAFGRLTGKPLSESGAFDPAFWLAAAGLFAAAGVAACAYPALVLSRFSPLTALRGHFSPHGAGGGLRKGLVVFQFACSAVLLFALLTVGRQLNFLKNHDKGLSLDQVVALKMPESDWRQDSLNRLRLNAFRQEIAGIAGLPAPGASGIVPGLGIGTISGSSGGLVLAARPTDVRPGTVYFIHTDKRFYETYGIRLLAGTPVERPLQHGGDRHVVVNQSALDLLGFPSAEAALGQEITWAGNTDGFRMTIDAVVADFHIESLREPTRPTLYYCQPDVGNGYFSFKIPAEQVGSALTALERSWKKTFPDSRFEYWFLDEHFARQYRAETQLGRVFGLFAALAVFIACLGLYGMALHSAARRSREIGVRKVLGASVAGVVGLLAGDVLKRVLLAVLLAAPPAWMGMNAWLSEFAHRIDLSAWMFVAAGATTMAFAVLTVGIQSLKAALADPVRALRQE